MKIQPLDTDSYGDTSAKPVVKSRLKRLFDRQFRVSSSEKAELEPSSIGLDKMVQSFIEDSSEKQKLSRSRCGCFNGNNYGSSDDEFDELDDYVVISSSIAWSDHLKELIQCGSKRERDLLADTSMIVDKNKTCKRKDDLNQIVTVGLALLGYDASICKSRWEKSPSVPAGDYEYIDVIVEGGKERVIIDVDFRSEFEIARSTSSYKWILQSLPHIYVGGPDRLHQIVSIVSEAAKQSLKKKGMHIPPWRKAEYMRAKWLSPHTRAITHGGTTDADEEEFHVQALKTVELRMDSECDDFVLIFCEEAASLVDASTTAGVMWQPPEIKPRSCEGNGSKVVTGLACLLREKP